MEWWLRPATDCASRVKRALETGSSARSARSSLTATVRPRRTSSAAKTSAMPPRPSLRVSRYRPSPTNPPFPHISGASDIPPPVASGSDGPWARCCCAISPRRRFCPRCARCCYGLRRPRYSLNASRRSEKGAGTGTGRTGHQTVTPSVRASSVYRPYSLCNADATLLSRTVTDRAPSLTCQCPGADLAGNSTLDHRQSTAPQGLRGTQNMSQDGAQGRYAGRALAAGRYQLRDLLGEGGMASVHLAYDAVLDRQVAVKTLHTELGREQAFRERFRREAQAVAKLTHTNIVSVFDTGEDEVEGLTTPYIVMEYIEGRPLGSVLDEDVRQQGAMPADKALKITADVLAALEISHEMGLVHRDIKPGNVMMTKRGVVKVMDFGIARAMQSGVTSMTQTGMVVGTPQYLSPEQALGRGVDARSDLYSVGIMLFQLVTGRLPFEADSPLAIAYAHVQEEPVAPSSINRALPPAVDALIARALKKNPNERFPSSESMRDQGLRVAGSFQAAAPSIVPGSGPTQSG